MCHSLQKALVPLFLVSLLNAGNLLADDGTGWDDLPPVTVSLYDNSSTSNVTPAVLQDLQPPALDPVPATAQPDLMGAAQTSCGCAPCDCTRSSPLSACLHSCCALVPHYMYFPSMHGYYYFLPYHHSHIRQQQAFAAQWGEDVRAPYANKVFKKVYAEYLKDRQAGGSADEG